MHFVNAFRRFTTASTVSGDHLAWQADDAAERNDRSDSINEEFGEAVGVGLERERESVVQLGGGNWAVGVDIRKLFVPAVFIIVK